MKFNINEIAEKAYKGFLFFVSVFIICLGVLGIPFIIKIFG